MALGSLTTPMLRRELARREKGARRLAVRREALSRRLAALDAELDALGLLGTALALASGRTARTAPPIRAAGRRSRGGTSLVEAIARAVRVGATVSPAEVATRVMAAGYRSSAAHFGMLVSNALARDARFRRIARGRYRRVR